MKQRQQTTDQNTTMKYLNHSHLESLTCLIQEGCISSGEPLPSDYIADLVIRYENDEDISFTAEEILRAVREGTEDFVSSMQHNAIDTPINKDFTPEDQDKQIDYWEAMRPSSVRRKKLLTILA